MASNSNFVDSPPRTPAARKPYGTSMEEEGYLHNVSNLLTAKKTNKEYFRAHLQTNEKIIPVVVFSPEKHKTFQNADRNGSPVKLLKLTSAHNAHTGEENYQVHNRTQISLLSTPLPFKRRTTVDTVHQPITATIHELMKKPNKQMCNVRCTIVSISEPQNVTINEQVVQLYDVLIADDTDQIMLNIYNEQIEEIELKTSYFISNCSTRTQYGRPKLTATKATVISQIDQKFNTANVKTVEDNMETHLGTISEVQCIFKEKCSCGREISTLNSTKFIRCKFCQLKTLKCNLTHSMFVKGTFKSATCNFKFIIFNSLITDFLKTVNQEKLCTDPENLEEFLLLLQKVEVTKNAHCETLKSIKLID